MDPKDDSFYLPDLKECFAGRRSIMQVVPMDMKERRLTSRQIMDRNFDKSGA
jgi:hypothetical protein